MENSKIISYYNNYNMLNSAIKKEGTIDENTLLYQGEYILLKRQFGLDYSEELYNYKQYLEACLADNGLFGELQGNKQKTSHDQLTSIISISYILGLDWHKQIWKDIKFFQYNNYKKWSIVHPRDWIYYGILNKNWLAYLLMPLLSLIMIESCHKTYKIRPTLFGRVKYRLTHWFKKDPSIRQFRATDGKLLSWVRFQALNMPITEKICNWLIRRNPVFGSWKNVFAIYFKDENHPIRKLSNLLDN